jgi:calcium-dependent protein kinase
MGACKAICLKAKDKDCEFDVQNGSIRFNGKENGNSIQHIVKSSHSKNDDLLSDGNKKGDSIIVGSSGINKIHSTHEINQNKESNIKIDGNLIVGKASGNVNENYKNIKKLGEGSYGSVYKVNHIHTSQHRAMKIIAKRATSSNDSKMDNEILNEIEMLKRMDHPNIVKIFEFFYSSKNYYLITEFCKEGELFETIVREGPFNEEFAGYILFQIFSAVNYCHSINILHRDLKPENILIERKEQNGFLKIKIIDFGTAKIFDTNKVERKIIGSSYYIAPEVLSKNYNEKCDLWSCGVIMYILLSSTPPFPGKEDAEIIENIKKGYYDIESNVWEKISPEAKNLIRNLLERNPSIRITAEEAMNHKWFKKLKIRDKLNFIPKEKIMKMLEALKLFQPDKILKRIAIAYLVHNNPQHQEVLDGCKLFNLIDKNFNGKITKLELKNGMNELTNYNEEESTKFVNQIFNLIDGDNNGYIEYEEFVRCCIDKEAFINEEVIKFSFRFFDIDKDGEITFDEVKDTFAKSFKKDVKYLDEAMLGIIKEVDTNGDKKISYKEFQTMMYSMLGK